MTGFGSSSKPALREEYAPEELEERLTLLRQSVVFFHLQDGALRSLARVMENAEARRGAQFVIQGRTNNNFFILRSGRCRVVHQTSPGHGVTIAILNPGDCIGEGTVLGDVTSNTSVIADADCKLLAMTKQSLEETLAKEPNFWADLSRIREQRQLLLESVIRNDFSVDHNSGKVIAVYSPKGGTGTSVVATNLAVSLAFAHPGDVVFFDLALPFNHGAVMAGLVPTTCLARIDRTGSDFEETILSTVVRHASGLQFLPSALRAEDADRIDSELVARTLEVLVANFRYVVIDTHSQLSEIVLTTFDLAQQIVLVGAYELAAIKDLEEVLVLFDQVLKIAPGRVVIAFDRRQEKAAITRVDIERSLQRAIDTEIPFVGNALEVASLKGELLVASERNGAFAKAIDKLVQKVALAPISSSV